ncbi:MAG: YlxR family protein [Microlunatus sp.]|nr:YlxR family protein [Microlunatus sp.]
MGAIARKRGSFGSAQLLDGGDCAQTLIAADTLADVHQPVRTCIGCRTRAAKAGLLRIAWQDGVVVDASQTAPGRGAYLHRRAECLQTAIKRRAVGRALRVSTVDPTAVAAVVGAYLPQMVEK